MNLLSLCPSRARVIGVTRRSKVVSFSTKKVVGTDGNGGQDGGHHHKCEEQQEGPHVDRGQRAFLGGQACQVPIIMKGKRV